MYPVQIVNNVLVAQWGGPEKPLSPPSQPSPIKGEGGLGFSPYRERNFASRRGVSTIPDGDTKFQPSILTHHPD